MAARRRRHGPGTDGGTVLIGPLLVALALPLSIGAGERDGASAPAVATHAAGDEIGARVETGFGTTPSADGGGSSGSGAPACQWLTAVIYGLPVVDIDLAGDGVLRRNHPVFGHRQYGIQEICDGAPRRFAWVDERAPTAAELTSGSLAEVRRRLPTPKLTTSPEAIAFVNLDTWLGVDDLTAVSAGVAADGLRDHGRPPWANPRNHRSCHLGDHLLLIGRRRESHPARHGERDGASRRGDTDGQPVTEGRGPIPEAV